MTPDEELVSKAVEKVYTIYEVLATLQWILSQCENEKTDMVHSDTSQTKKHEAIEFNNSFKASPKKTR